MKLGISIRNFGWFENRGGAEDQVRIAERAEQLGFDAVWAHDHLVMPARHHARYPESSFGARQDIYDPIAMLSGIAARTSRIKLGFCVLVIPYRNPLVLGEDAGYAGLSLQRQSHPWSGGWVDAGRVRDP